jgi:3-methylcrotonyl-CoA carboxylase alpha subunit
VDSGVVEGDEVSIYYDPLLAKLVASAETREAARQRMLAALRRFAILGIRTNIPFLIRVLEHPRFVEAAIDTSFLDREGHGLGEQHAGPGLEAALAAAAAYDGRPAARAAETPAVADPWDRLAGWRQGQG